MDPGCCSCLFLGLPPLWVLWYLQLAPVTRMASRDADRLVLYLAPLVCLATLSAGLLLGGWAYEPGWVGQVLLVTANGATCLFLSSLAFPWLGLSPRDDVAERRNRPAGWAIAGGLLGLALAFGLAAGVSTPRSRWGPVPLGAGAMLALLGVWGAFERLAGLSEAITVERDAGSAYRLAVFLPVAGALLGLAAASLDAGHQTIAAVLSGAVAAGLLVAVLMERRRR